MSIPVIRRATVDDIPSIVELRLAFRRHFGPVGDEDALRRDVADYLRRAMPSEACVVWVSECDGAIVGSGVMTVYERMMHNGVGRERYVLSMFTAPEHRGRGIASDMIGQIVDYAKAHDLSLWLMATDEGRPIYERVGFRPDDRYLRWR